MPLQKFVIYFKLSAADLLKIKLPAEEIYRPARTVLGELVLGAVDELEWSLMIDKGGL